MERPDERARHEADRHGLVGLEDQRREGVGRRLHRALPRVRHRHHRRQEDRNYFADGFSR